MRPRSKLIPVHRDGLTMAKLCAEPGKCMFCEAPLRWRKRDKRPRETKRRKMTCGSKECSRAYNTAWRRDWFMAREWARWRKG